MSAHAPQSESFGGRNQYKKQLQESQTAKHFKPPGELLEEYTSKGRRFEIWYGELSNPEVKLLISRIQILVSFFIEGGTPLELDDQEWSLARWRVYFVYVSSSGSLLILTIWQLRNHQTFRVKCLPLFHSWLLDFLPLHSLHT